MQSQLDDIKLMQRIAARDQTAFRALYQQYGKAVYSLAYRVLQNGTLAEEVTQDTFLKVWQQKTQWDPNKGKLKNWLLAITHFTAIDRLRQERRQPALYPESIEDMEDMAQAVATEPLWQEGTVLRMLVTQLPDDMALLIELAFFRGMSHSEIASETHIPLGTVKTRLRTGLQRLREQWLEAVNRTSTHP
ncbi:MAG: sigma-70 family RNA polymerase sigma factor [Chloroflexi bacterium]|nr:sigma-70 family RNA polymerase sigma factor [Chloroflexota bacterium]